MRVRPLRDALRPELRGNFWVGIRFHAIESPFPPLKIIAFSLLLVPALAPRLAAADPAPAQTPAILMAPESAGLPVMPAVVRQETRAQHDARLSSGYLEWQAY